MRNAHRRLAAIVRVATAAAVALIIATPASAQLGALKKKLKPAAAEPTAQAEPAETGVVVLTNDVLDRLIVGLKAADSEKQAAAKADTPYGRHKRAVTAYDEAKAKCQVGQQQFTSRMVADEKLMDKYNATVNKMVEAQQRGDTKAQMAYNDSALAMQDPSCVVKEPKQPADYWETQRQIDYQAEQTAIKASGFSRGEYSQIRERVEMVLIGTAPPGDMSAAEKSAVTARAGELRPLLGITPPPAPVQAAAPTAPPPPAPAQAPPVAPAGSSEMGACVSQNAQKHEKELRALGERAQAAQQAGNTAALMAIADTMQRIQMAGCTGGR